MFEILDWIKRLSTSGGNNGLTGVYIVCIIYTKKGVDNMAKKRVNITITEETQERILQYAYENHLQGGLSGAIEHIAWQVLKVKNAQVRGQSSMKFDK